MKQDLKPYFRILFVISFISFSLPIGFYRFTGYGIYLLGIILLSIMCSKINKFFISKSKYEVDEAILNLRNRYEIIKEEDNVIYLKSKKENFMILLKTIKVNDEYEIIFEEIEKK